MSTYIILLFVLALAPLCLKDGRYMYAEALKYVALRKKLAAHKPLESGDPVLYERPDAGTELIAKYTETQSFRQQSFPMMYARHLERNKQITNARVLAEYERFLSATEIPEAYKVCRVGDNLVRWDDLTEAQREVVRRTLSTKSDKP